MTKRNYQLFRIDSAFRSHGTLSEFAYSADTDVKFKCAKIMNVEFPNTIYPISTARESDLLQVNQNGTIINALLSPGNYSSTQFAIELEDQLNTATNSNALYTVVYDAITGKLTISNVVVIDLLFSISGDINRIMGFTKNDTGSLLSHTSSGVIDLSGPRYLVFDINPMPSSSRIVSGNGTSGLFTIQLRAPFGGIDFLGEDELGFDLVVSTGTKFNMKNIKITVYDEFGRIPELSLDWSMLLRLE